MNCCPITPGQKPHERLGEPADADHAAREGILDDSRDAAGQHAGSGPRRQRHVDHDDEHQIDGGRATDHEPRQRRLQRERQSYREQDTGDFHSEPSAPVVAADGVSTTRTSSREENSTAGFTMMELKTPAPFSIDSI